MRNLKPLAALILTGIGSTLVATFQVAEPPVIAASTGTTTASTSTSATATTAGPTTASSSASPTTGSTAITSPTTATPTAATATPNLTTSVTTAQYTDGTYSGSAVREPWGTFQVQATISGGKLVDVKLVASPSDGHSSRINSSAVPLLTQATIAAQSAQVDTISGATWTSQSYSTSLQAALDSAQVAAATTQAAG